MPRLLVGVFLCVSMLVAHAETLSYWIAPGPDVQLAEWALAAWAKASNGNLVWVRSDSRDRALVRIVWASAEEGLYGEARMITVNGRRGSEVYVRPAPLETRDVLLRDGMTYLTCVHETGHALGLAHTARFDDIMYSFQFGGDIQEYFGRYRRSISTREDIRNHSGLSEMDVARLRRIYQ